MCGRATLTKTEKEIEERFMATFYSEDLERYNPLPSYNIAPTHRHPVITGKDQEHISLFRWGLIPFWAKEASIGSKMINARVETLAEKNAYKYALEERRCLVPFDSFYEWKKTEYGRIPYRIILKNIPIFSIAGLWENWTSASGDLIRTFTLITQPANNFMATIHDRMPAILLPEHEKEWIDQNRTQEEALQLIQALPDDIMDAYTVSERVNKVRNNDPALIDHQPYTPPPKQGNLFEHL